MYINSNFTIPRHKMTIISSACVGIYWCCDSSLSVLPLKTYIMTLCSFSWMREGSPPTEESVLKNDLLMYDTAHFNSLLCSPSPFFFSLNYLHTSTVCSRCMSMILQFLGIESRMPFLLGLNTWQIIHKRNILYNLNISGNTKFQTDGFSISSAVVL